MFKKLASLFSSKKDEFPEAGTTKASAFYPAARNSTSTHGSGGLEHVHAQRPSGEGPNSPQATKSKKSGLFGLRKKTNSTKSVNSASSQPSGTPGGHYRNPSQNLSMDLKSQSSSASAIRNPSLGSQEQDSFGSSGQAVRLVTNPTDPKQLNDVPLRSAKPGLEGMPPSPWSGDTAPEPIAKSHPATPIKPDVSDPESDPPVPKPSITPRPSDSAESIGSQTELVPFPANLGSSVIGLRNAPKVSFSPAAEQQIAAEMQHIAHDIEDDRVALKDVKVIQENGRPVELGEGGFGKVYKGSLRKEVCALKSVNQGTRKEQSRFLQEIRILGKLKTKYITRFMGYSVTPDGLVLIMEYVPGGTLFKSLQISNTHRWYQRGKEVLLNVAIAVIHLHSKRIAHLDLKSPNILIDANGEAKVADCGLSKLCKSDISLVSMPGSFPWSAPEQLSGQAGMCSDIWSFGTLIWEVCTGEKPPMNRYLRPIEVPKEAPRQVVQLLKKCHCPNTFDRIDADQLYTMIEACPSEMPVH